MFAIYSKDDLAVKQMRSKEVANSLVPKLPSFRRFVEAQSGKEKLDLLVDDAYIKVGRNICVKLISVIISLINATGHCHKIGRRSAGPF